MSTLDRTRTIVSAKARAPATLALQWSDGTKAEIDLSDALRRKAYRPLRDPAEFARARVGEWGHSVAWPCGLELGAEALWLVTLAAIGRPDICAFLE